MAEEARLLELYFELEFVDGKCGGWLGSQIPGDSSEFCSDLLDRFLAQGPVGNITGFCSWIAPMELLEYLYTLPFFSAHQEFQTLELTNPKA